MSTRGRDKDEEEEEGALVIGHSKNASLHTFEVHLASFKTLPAFNKERSERSLGTSTCIVFSYIITSSYVLSYGTYVHTNTHTHIITVLSYVLFGMRVFSEPFTLSRSDFKEMRDSFLIKSTKDDLLKFFKTSAPVYLEIFPESDMKKKESVAAGAVPVGYKLAHVMGSSESDVVGEIEITVARQKLFDQDCAPIAEISVLASVRSEQGTLIIKKKKVEDSLEPVPSSSLSPPIVAEKNTTTSSSPQVSKSGHTVQSLTQWEERIRAKERELDRELNERLTKERQSLRRIAAKRATALDLRDKERAAILAQASEKYDNLEKELRHALEEVERRERALRNERSVMMSEVKEKMDALKAEERRLGMDVEQRKQLQRDRVQDFVQRLRNAEAQRVAAEKRLVEIECEFAEFRRETRSTPLAEIKTDLVECRAELSRVTKDLEIERREHVETKRNLMRLAAELKRREKNERQRRESEAKQLRLQYAAREQKLILDTDRRRLMGIRRDLQRLRMSKSGSNTMSSTIRQQHSVPENEDESVDALLDNGSAVSSSSPKSHEHAVEEKLSELERLERQRSRLLQTVGYGKDHPLVKRLTEAIELESASLSK